MGRATWRSRKEAILANDIDSIGFTGIKITSDNGGNGLIALGSGSCICQLCELDSPLVEQQSGSQFGFQANCILRSWVYNFPTFEVSSASCRD